MIDRLISILVSMVFFTIVFSAMDYVGALNIYDEPGITKISCMVFFGMLLEFIAGILFEEIDNS